MGKTWGNADDSKRALRRRITELEAKLFETMQNLTMTRIALSEHDMDAELATLLDNEENQ